MSQRLKLPWFWIIVTAVSFLVMLAVTVDFIMQTVSTYSFMGLLGIIGKWFVTTSDGQLVGIGIILATISCTAWVLSNRAEATPNLDQLDEMQRFVTGHFASYVARGFVAEGIKPEEVAIAHDPAWRRIYLQHLKLHNELYAFRQAIALQVFETYVDDAVRAHLVAMREAGIRPEPVLAASEPPADG